MSIFKRGNVYWYHFLFNGQHIQESTKQGNPRVARQIEAAFRTALAKGEVGITERKKAPGFKAAMRSFLAWSEQQHKRHPATSRRYRVSSAALLSHFGDPPIDRITPEDVERFKATRAMEYKTVKGKEKGQRKQTKKRLMPATVNRELACLKALFNHAVKSDLAVRNPVSRVDFLSEQNEQTRVLSFDEQARYLAAATPMLRDIATTTVAPGFPISWGNGSTRSAAAGCTRAAGRSVSAWFWPGRACAPLAARVCRCPGRVLAVPHGSAMRVVPPGAADGPVPPLVGTGAARKVRMNSLVTTRLAPPALAPLGDAAGAGAGTGPGRCSVLQASPPHPWPSGRAASCSTTAAASRSRPCRQRSRPITSRSTSTGSARANGSIRSGRCCVPRRTRLTWQVQGLALTERVARALWAEHPLRPRGPDSSGGHPGGRTMAAGLLPFRTPSSAFSFRADLDETIVGGLRPFLRRARPGWPTAARTSSALAAYGESPAVLQDLLRFDSQSHGHLHVCTATPRRTAATCTRAHGCSRIGFRAGRLRLAPRAMERLGWTSGLKTWATSIRLIFSLVSTTCRSSPVRATAFPSVLQAPIHPVCEGLFFNAGETTGRAVAEYLARVVRANDQRASPPSCTDTPSAGSPATRRCSRPCTRRRRAAPPLRVTLTEFALLAVLAE